MHVQVAPVGAVLVDRGVVRVVVAPRRGGSQAAPFEGVVDDQGHAVEAAELVAADRVGDGGNPARVQVRRLVDRQPGDARSEEHTSELQSLMRISYAVFCLKKKNTNTSLSLHDTNHEPSDCQLRYRQYN